MLKNKKIATKLILCFMIVVLISGLSGIIATVLLVKTDSDYSEALIKNGFSQGEIGTFNTYLNKGASTVRDIVLLTDADDIENAQQELKDIQEKTAAAFDKMKINCQTPEELKFIGIIETKYPEYIALREKVVEMGLQNKNDEALALFRTQAAPKLEEVIQAAEALSDYNVTMGNEVSESLTQQSRVTVISVIAVIIAGFISSVLFAVSVAKAIARPIIRVNESARQLKEGNLNIQISADSQDEIGEMTQSFSDAADMMKKSIADITRGLTEIANGNFNITAGITFVGEFKLIEEAIKTITTKLSDTLGQINVAADQVSCGADQVSGGAQALSQGTAEQASSIEELAATINEISSQVQKTAGNAESAREKAKAVGTDMAYSNQQMQKMIEAMNEINSSSSEIGKIIKTIEDIAFQTNILALNAAVEAARAGSAGKGFAVVADEVRNLASKSAEASKSTSALIANSVRAVESGTKIAGSTAQSLSQSAAGAQEVVTLVEYIAADSKEQSDSISQITQGIDQISSVVQTNSATAEESAAASEELTGQAQMLRELVGNFQLKS